MKVICKKYPQLRIYDLRIVFRNGEAEISTADQIEALQNMQGFGFEFVEESPNTFSDMSIKQLKEYASEKGIDLGSATSVSGIVKKIEAVLK